MDFLLTTAGGCIILATIWFGIDSAQRKNKDYIDMLDELARWRSAWKETRRWLAEFHDVADALEHLHAKATGAGGTDIVRTREVMRKRRDVRASIDAVRAHPAVQAASAGLTAQAAAAREEDFRVNYQNLSAECSDGD